MTRGGVSKMTLGGVSEDDPVGVFQSMTLQTRTPVVKTRSSILHAVVDTFGTCMTHRPHPMPLSHSMKAHPPLQTS